MATKIYGKKKKTCSNLMDAKWAINNYLTSWEGRRMLDAAKEESKELNQKRKEAYAQHAVAVAKEAEYYESVLAINCFDSAWYDVEQGVGGKSSADYCLENYVRYYIEAKRSALLASC